MSNIAGKAYAMNVITPSPRRTDISLLRLRFRLKATWLNEVIFLGSRGVPKMLYELLGLSLIHFARWVFIRPKDWPVFDEEGKRRRALIQRDYMLFCSNFNGTWDQYIDAFSDGAPVRLDQAWYTAIGYPGSIPSSAFKRYITHNQVDTDYYYNATPGAGQRDVKAALRVRKAVLELKTVYDTAEGSEDERLAAFEAAWRKCLGAVQTSLPEPGYAPVASPDTERANRARLRRLAGVET